jgi:hypothetical protein
MWGELGAGMGRAGEGKECPGIVVVDGKEGRLWKMRGIGKED